MAGRGLCLETSLYHPQLAELAAFARAVPDLTIILNHIGGLVRIGAYANRDDEVLPAWRGGIAAVAACPNVLIKLDGVGQPRFGVDWHTRAQPIGSGELAAALSPLMQYCIEQFGPNRCMCESNFPVDKVSYAYKVVYNAFKRLSSWIPMTTASWAAGWSWNGQGGTTAQASSSGHAGRQRPSSIT